MTSPIGFQVTFDAADPHAQARFWAAALGYEVELHDDFIRRSAEVLPSAADAVLGWVSRGSPPLR